MTRIPKWLWVAAPVGLAFIVFVGGGVVMLLWNSLLPPLFGLPQVGFWQALGLLALSRILFGGFGLGGGSHHSGSGKRMGFCGKEMTPEEVERLRHGLHDRGAGTPEPGATSGA